MNRISYFLLTVAAALYLLVNGIWGITGRGGSFATMADKLNIGASWLIIVLSICGIAAGIFLLLALFRVDVPITDIILLGFIVLWIIYIIFVNIIGGIGGNLLSFLSELAMSFLILGALMLSTRRFGYSG